MANINQSNDAGESVWYTPKSLAAQLQVSVETVLGWIWSGQLKAINVAKTTGGRPRWRIDPKAFEQFTLIRQSQASIARESPSSATQQLRLCLSSTSRPHPEALQQFAQAYASFAFSSESLLPQSKALDSHITWTKKR